MAFFEVDAVICCGEDKHTDRKFLVKAESALKAVDLLRKHHDIVFVSSTLEKKYWKLVIE